MALTGLMMVAEIIAGTVFNSMALLADGWHMSTHMTAFLIAVVAYYFARKHKDDKKFSFGTGKIGVLGGYTSSILLLVVAVIMIRESVLRLLDPSDIRFKDALVVASVGFLVNIVSAVILNQSRDHPHGSTHSHAHDKNLQAAYVHVIADAFTSVTAIFALLVGYFSGIVWIDAIMGFLGSVVIIVWAIRILKDTTAVLVDYIPKSCDLEHEITKALQNMGDTKINDLHIWQVASGKYAAIISLESEKVRKVEEYYRLVDVHEELVHVSIQVCQ